MNVRKLATSSWSSESPPAQLPTASSFPAGIPDGAAGARSSHPAGSVIPLGFDSAENAVTDVPLMQCCVVIPISFT
jgi:hypothetical protein